MGLGVGLGLGLRLGLGLGLGSGLGLALSPFSHLGAVGELVDEGDAEIGVGQRDARPRAVAAHLRLPQPEHLDGGADAEDDERGEQQTDGYRRPVRQPEGVARAAVGAVGAGRADKVDALWVHGVVAQPVARPGAPAGGWHDR